MRGALVPVSAAPGLLAQLGTGSPRPSLRGEDLLTPPGQLQDHFLHQPPREAQPLCPLGLATLGSAPKTPL